MMISFDANKTNIRIYEYKLPGANGAIISRGRRPVIVAVSLSVSSPRETSSASVGLRLVARLVGWLSQAVAATERNLSARFIIYQSGKLSFIKRLDSSGRLMAGQCTCQTDIA